MLLGALWLRRELGCLVNLCLCTDDGACWTFRQRLLGSLEVFFGESAVATSVFFFRHILSRSVGVFEEH